MKNQKELQLEKMLEVLKGFGLSADLLETAENYILEGNKELLTLFPKQNLKKIKREEQQNSIHMFSGLLKKNRLEEALRLFHIVYQIGGSTSAYVFPVQEIRYNVENHDFIKNIKADQSVSLYAEGVVYEEFQLRRETVRKLLVLAGNRKEVLLTALDNWQSEYDNGKMLIFAAYISLIEENGPESEEKSSILSGLTGIFRKNEAEYPGAPDERKYMKNFEESVLGSIRNLIPVSEEENAKIQEYLKKDKGENSSLMEEAATLFKKYPMDTYLLKLLAGCINIHYSLTGRLHKFMKLCMAGNLEGTMNAVYAFMKKKDTGYFKGILKADLMPEPVGYIIWCGKNGIKAALGYEIEQDYESYKKAAEQAPLEIHAVLMEALREKLPGQYEKLAGSNVLKLQGKVTDRILPEGNARTVVQDFLLGNGGIEALYPYVKELRNNRNYYYSPARTLENYKKTYGHDAFYKRCMAYLAFRERGYFFSYNFKPDGEGGYLEKEIKVLFCDWKDTGLALLYQLNAAEFIYEDIYQEKRKASFLRCAVQVFTKYLDEKEEEMLKAFEQAGASGRFMGICTLGTKADRYKENLLKAFQDASKLVKERLVETMAEHEDWEQDVLDKLKAKKSAEREAALLILARWKKDYKAALEEALAVEKSNKLLDMIINLMGVDDTESTGAVSVREYIERMHKGGRKKGLKWAYETSFITVHAEDGTEIEEEYMQAILLSYSSMGIPGVNREVYLLTQPLNKKELALFMNELFDKWREKGAEAKKKWVLYAAAIHGGDDIVHKFQSNIKQWPQNARGAIAAEAVKALALNDSPSALLFVDSISRKFKFKQIKTAASEALRFAAEQLGLTTEELADKIVPDFGFNERMQRSFDYGDRRFMVSVTPALEIQILDENNKKIKNLPKPGKKDDEVKAQAAFEEFKLLKKQMKAAVANQKLRLDLALSVERKWDIKDWKALFVKNPIMHQFAICLIWGIYEEDKLLHIFRYMEDGSYNTEEEEEFILPQKGKIGLVHPIELSAESIKIWEEQLKDYEVIQPVEQLTRKVFEVKEEEKGKKKLERFGGYILNPMSLSGKLLGMGWYRGSVQDAGGYYTFYREDAPLSLGVELQFSGSFVGYETEDVTVYGACFYRAGTIKRGSYEYDEVTEEKAISLDKIPARYFSEIVYQLEKATVSSQERDENWKSNQ